MTSVDETETGNSEAATNGGAKKVSQEVEVPSDLQQKIIRQVEFYFGDANLPRDKFMLDQIKVDDGWIPMSTMLKFQRLANISADPKVIAAALKNSDLIEVDTTGEEPKIRRSPEHPLPELNEERRKEIWGRTIYCKGFPLDSSLDVVIAALEEYGPTDNIIMRKYKDTVTQKFLFKGSIFATFPTKEKAQAFLDLPSIKVGETELLRMFATDYHEKKRNELLKRKRPHEKESVKEKEEPFKKSLNKGSTIKLEGDFKAETKREDLKAAFTAFEIDVAYIGFNQGDQKAYIRLHGANSAKAVLEKIDNALTVLDVKLNAQALEGEEEEEYLKKTQEEMKAFQQRSRSNKFNRKGNKGFKGKKQRGRDDGEPQSKKSR